MVSLDGLELLATERLTSELEFPMNKCPKRQGMDTAGLIKDCLRLSERDFRRMPLAKESAETT